MILSPMPTGSGAIVVHRMLEKAIQGYRVAPYSPYCEFFPPLLSFKFRSKTAELIHTTPDYGLFFTKSSRPLIVTFHNFVLDRFMCKHSTLYQRIHYNTDLKWFTKHSLRSATAITSVSKFIAELAGKELGIKDDIRIIYNGIDENKFTPRTKMRNKTIKILVVGNQNRRKGTHLIPLIAKKINPRIKIVYTQGLKSKNLLSQYSNLENIGGFQYEDMPLVYRKADILLFPTFREGFGLVVAEAMACGLPVVTTDCSALPELIDHGKGGFLCPVGDVDDFAEKINILADSPKLRQEMGEYNRAKVEKLFTLERMVKEYKNLFEEILSTPKKTH